MRKFIVFASGSATGGGSGFRKICESLRNGVINGDLVTVVSHHENGGVRAIAKEFNIPFILFKGPYTAEEYQRIVKETGAEFIVLSGWLKFVRGLNPAKTFNIHPGRLPEFGGKGMYGHFVHEAVIAAYERGEITDTVVTMHFVVDTVEGDTSIDAYDKGPKIFEISVPIFPGDTGETLGKRVNTMEHTWQSKITNMVINGEISWTGKSRDQVNGAMLL